MAVLCRLRRDELDPEASLAEPVAARVLGSSLQGGRDALGPRTRPRPAARVRAMPGASAANARPGMRQRLGGACPRRGRLGRDRPRLQRGGDRHGPDGCRSPRRPSHARRFLHVRTRRSRSKRSTSARSCAHCRGACGRTTPSGRRRCSCRVACSPATSTSPTSRRARRSARVPPHCMRSSIHVSPSRTIARSGTRSRCSTAANAGKCGGGASGLLPPVPAH